MGTVIRPEISARSTYYISRHRYYELKHFCLQYPEWKQNYHDLDGRPTKSASVCEHISGGKVSDPTAVYAEARLYFRERMEMVERSCEKADGDLAGFLLQAVTEGVSYEYISPPCCKEVWYAAYRRFFWLLDKARK